jgi:hypothetical protein
LINRRFRYRKKMNKTLFRILVSSIALAVCIGLIVFLVVFHVDDVEIVGNTRNSEEEVEEVVLRGPLASNSFLLSLFRKTVVTDELPFVESVEIEALSPGKIRLHVNEKQIVGYVRYLDCNMYFDKDGIVVESEVADISDEEDSAVEPDTVVAPVEVQNENETAYHAAVTDVPYITGLKFDSVVTDKKLPVKDDSVFNTILGIARIVEKYQIMPDQVEFSDQYEITLYYGSIRVMLGVDNLLEEKITRVAAILPRLSGKAGILHMEDYTGDTVNIIFSEDVPEDESDEASNQEEETSGEESDTAEEISGEESDTAGETAGDTEEDTLQEDTSQEETANEDASEEDSVQDETTEEDAAGEEMTEESQSWE